MTYTHLPKKKIANKDLVDSNSLLILFSKYKALNTNIT